MSADTREMLDAQVRAQRDGIETALEHAAELAGDADHDPDECETCEEMGYTPEDALDVLNNEALSVEYTWRGESRDSADLDTVTIVLATGGPHVEIVHTGGEFADVLGYWGGEKSRLPAGPHTVTLAESLMEMAE